MTSPFKQFMSKLEKRCKELGIPYRKVNSNQCVSCGYNPIKDLKATRKLKSIP